jgi:hypothetical protein
MSEDFRGVDTWEQIIHAAAPIRQLSPPLGAFTVKITRGQEW